MHSIKGIGFEQVGKLFVLFGKTLIGILRLLAGDQQLQRRLVIAP